jgi:hypothetical protein
MRDKLDMPSAQTISVWIKHYYSLEGNSSGGNCHVVLDDNNLEDHFIEKCLEICIYKDDLLGALIMRAFMSMKKTARGKAIKLAKQVEEN